MTKRLIINADDYGATEDVNRRIIKCYTQGAVTDISLSAAGDSFSHACELAKKHNIKKIGVHLTLTDSFRSVSPAEEIGTLVDRNSRFPKSYSLFLARYFAGLVNKNEICTEFKNQIFKVKKAGFKITHLDGHHHIHIVPGILKNVIKLAKEENVNNIRFPLEKINIFVKFANPRACARNILLSFMCRLSRDLLRASGMKYNEYFIGHANALRLRKKDFISAVPGIKDGLTELGCHPGNFEEEMNVLCNGGFVNELKSRSVELTSH